MASFEKLLVYQKSIEFTHQVYLITEKWPKSEIFGIISQLRRAALSIALNIAEGNSRTQKDFAHFLIISRGSCYECIPILAIALKIGYITSKEYQICYTQVEEIAKMISGLRNAVIKK